ncbi:MAG: hypothetical protein KGM17_11865 [Sphingomonadales bacterium]|nr:hypothetical protein [Sphingomonadales bacterium]
MNQGPDDLPDHDLRDAEMDFAAMGVTGPALLTGRTATFKALRHKARNARPFEQEKPGSTILPGRNLPSRSSRKTLSYIPALCKLPGAP